MQGSPFLNGNAVSSLTLVGMYIQILAYSLPLLAVFLPMIVPIPARAKVSPVATKTATCMLLYSVTMLVH